MLAEYNPKCFVVVIMRISEPKTTALIFASGKMVFRRVHLLQNEACLWSVKATIFLAFMVLPFFLPIEFIEMYGKLLTLVLGIFLLIQLVSVISFIHCLNDCCLSEKYAERCRVYLTLIATTYILSILGIIMMYIWYALEPSCLLNIFYITSTLVLLHLMTSVPLQPRVTRSVHTQQGNLSPHEQKTIKAIV